MRSQKRVSGINVKLEKVNAIKSPPGYKTRELYKMIQYLTINPRARMGYSLRGHEGERNNCFSKIQLVGQKYQDKATFS